MSILTGDNPFQDYLKEIKEGPYEYHTRMVKHHQKMDAAGHDDGEHDEAAEAHARAAESHRTGDPMKHSDSKDADTASKEANNGN